MTTLPKFMGGALTLSGCARKTEHLVPVNLTRTNFIREGLPKGRTPLP